MTLAPVEHANTLADKINYAKALAAASLIPRSYQSHPADVLVAIEYGEALGLRPIVAMTEINVINSTPSLSGRLMASLARNAGHKVRIEGDDHKATCTIIRSDDPDFPHVATWDEAKARKAQLWGKGHWTKDPATMLKWRAVAECVRFACPEVLAGIAYTPEEVEEFSPAPASRPTPPPAISLAEAIAAEEAEPVEADVVDDYDGALIPAAS